MGPSSGAAFIRISRSLRDTTSVASGAQAEPFSGGAAEDEGKPGPPTSRRSVAPCRWRGAATLSAGSSSSALRVDTLGTQACGIPAIFRKVRAPACPRKPEKQKAASQIRDPPVSCAPPEPACWKSVAAKSHSTATRTTPASSTVRGVATQSDVRCSQPSWATALPLDTRRGT